MKYTTTNVQASLALDLARFLQAEGYDVLWQATQTRWGQSAGLATAKATVTIAPDFPDDPRLIVRLNSDPAVAQEIVVPALAVVVEPRERAGGMGLGHRDSLWERRVVVDGFAADAFQQRELVDALSAWLTREPSYAVAAVDVDNAPAVGADDVPTLDPLTVRKAEADPPTVAVTELEAVRFYVRLVAYVQYVE
jgi:hypothetical protein